VYSEFQLSEIIMSDFTFIVLARAIHVMAGVTWAGAAFILAMVVIPLAAQHGAEGAGRWLSLVARRAGTFMGISALLTVVSGIYLFAILHSRDASAGGLVLKSGAAAALLALAIGLLVARPAGQKLAKLHEGRTDGAGDGRVPLCLGRGVTHAGAAAPGKGASAKSRFFNKLARFLVAPDASVFGEDA
jgi:uncharacterized membrane protein